MSEIKTFAKQTVIYGFSTIIPRFLNYLLVPFYTRIFIPAEYGIITELYAYVAILLVVLSFGLETGYFRFFSSSKNNQIDVYSNIMNVIVFINIIFIGVIFYFNHSIAYFLNYSDHPEYIIWFAIILSVDVLSSIPFAKLRYDERAVRFTLLKIAGVIINIGLNLFFFIYCPYLLKKNLDIIRIIYSPAIGIGYVFISNLIASIVTFIFLIPEFKNYKLTFNPGFVKELIFYCFPLMLTGLGSNINETLDRILIKHLVNDDNAIGQLGIYGANIKIAVIIVLFTQMFRYAFEPFFFRKAQQKNSPQLFADILKYYVIINLCVFLIVTCFLEYFKFFIGKEYYSGLSIVPPVMISYIFLGILVSLSVWYKVENLTRYGIYITLIGSLITIGGSFILIPWFGYQAAAWVKLICYLSMCILSYIMGQRKYPIPYNIKQILFYFILALFIFFVTSYVKLNDVFMFLFKTVLVVSFIIFVFMKEKILIKLLRKE